MKVVINGSIGGFNLSPRALMEYADRKGFKLYFYEDSLDDGEKYIKIKNTDKCGYFVCSLKDLGNKTGSEIFNDENYFRDSDIARQDPDLIAVVEYLGEQANGCCGELKIVEIPDDVEWYIDSFDNGCEIIREKHRTWG